MSTPCNAFAKSRAERILSAIDQAVEVPGTVVAPILQPRPGERRTLTTVLLRRRG